MAWSTSDVFRFWLAESVKRSTAFDLDGDTFKAALYNNSITPDQNVATDVLSGYNGSGSQWVTANEVSHSGQWAAGGVALTSPTVNSGTSGVVFWDASDTASGSAATLSGAYGCLVYDDTLTNDPGVCFNYFGGSNSVTNGTFTIVWSANGIWRATL